MAELMIPEEYERGFVAIRGLEEAQVESLVSTLESEPPTLNRADLRTRVTSKLSNISRNDFDRVMETLVSLYALRDSLNLGAVDFADIICDAVEESGIEELEFDGNEDRDFFKDRLARLLGVESLDVAARVTELLNDGGYRIALKKFIEKHEGDRLTKQINDAYDEEMEREDEEFLSHARGHYRRLTTPED